MLTRRRIDFEQYITLFDRLVVADAQFDDAAVDLRGDADRVRSRVRVIGARRRIKVVDDVSGESDGDHDDDGPEQPPEHAAPALRPWGGSRARLVGHSFFLSRGT